MITSHSVVEVSRQQVSCALSEGKAILNLEKGTYHGLDGVGARIWELLEEPRTVASVLEVLLREYEVEPDRCERDLVRLLEALAEQGLIDVRDPTSS